MFSHGCVAWYAACVVCVCVCVCLCHTYRVSVSIASLSSCVGGTPSLRHAARPACVTAWSATISHSLGHSNMRNVALHCTTHRHTHTHKSASYKRLCCMLSAWSTHNPAWFASNMWLSAPAQCAAVWWLKCVHKCSTKKVCVRLWPVGGLWCTCLFAPECIAWVPVWVRDPDCVHLDAAPPRPLIVLCVPLRTVI